MKHAVNHTKIFSMVYIFISSEIYQLKLNITTTNICGKTPTEKYIKYYDTKIMTYTDYKTKQNMKVLNNYEIGKLTSLLKGQQLETKNHNLIN